MITKEQAMLLTHGAIIKQVLQMNGTVKCNFGSITTRFIPDGTTSELSKPINWRINGACKTWKRDATRFQIPIKHGLYEYGYLTNENAHLFEVAE